MAEAEERRRKRQLVEEEIVNEDDEEDEDNGRVYEHDYYSDFETLDGVKVDPELLKQYYKQWEDSEGFDITIHPGSICDHSIVPMSNYLNDPNEKQEFSDLCKLAIDTFNSQNAKNYKFKDIVWVTASFAAGIFYHFTFEATDANAAADATKTFQALVWDGVDGTKDVEFCRLKKMPTNQGDEGSPQSRVDEGSPHSRVDKGSPNSIVDVDAGQ